MSAGPDVTDSPASHRAHQLVHDVVPYVEALFARVPRMRSVLLAVAQYWADEADDAVHETFVFSASDEPAWPHRCGDGEEPEGAGFLTTADRCTSCSWGEPALQVEVATTDRRTGEPRTVNQELRCRWDDNSAAIRPWQAFCVEGSQELGPAACATPVVLFRRGPEGVLVEWLSPPARAWLDLPSAALPTWHAEEGALALPTPEPGPLPPAWTPFLDAVAARPEDDGPRLVFADWLAQAGDPKGPFIVESLRPQTATLKDRRVRAILEHGEAWLSTLARVVSPAGADFSRGVVQGGVVSLVSEALMPAMDDPLFRLFRWLHYSPEGRVRLPARRDSLSQVTGLRPGEVNVRALERLTHLGLWVHDGAAGVGPVLQRLPGLRAVALAGESVEGLLELVPVVAATPAIEVVELWAAVEDVSHVHRLAAEAAKRLPRVARVSAALTTMASGLPGARRHDVERGPTAVPPFLAATFSGSMWVPLTSDDDQAAEGSAPRRLLQLVRT